jgi:hypothetical protein
MIELSEEDKLNRELLDLLEAKEQEVKYNKIDTLFPDEGHYRRELYPKHVDFMNASSQFSQLAFIAANRPLDDSTLVCMADGTKKELKDVIVGEYVLAMNVKTLIAEPSKVVDIPYIGKEEVFEISCYRDKKVIATADHEFPISYRSGTRRIKNIAIKDINLNRKSSTKHSLVTPNFIDYKINKELPLHPYALGCLLGDGSIKFNGINITNIDEKVLNRFCEKGNFTIKLISKITYGIQQGNIRDKVTGRYLSLIHI